MSECEHDWVPYKLVPRHVVGTNVGGDAVVYGNQISGFYTSKVKCVKCGEEKEMDTVKGDFERQMELQRKEPENEE